MKQLKTAWAIFWGWLLLRSPQNCTRFKKLHDQSGQAVIEFAVVGFFASAAMAATVLLILKQTLLLAVDDALESYLTCRTYSNSTQQECLIRFKKKIEILQLQIRDVSERSRRSTTTIDLKLTHRVLGTHQRSRQIRIPH